MQRRGLWKPGYGLCLRVAIPLRGYVVCNRAEAWLASKAFLEVAIPLRGYVVCNRR